jgi:hypothetical protein
MARYNELPCGSGSGQTGGDFLKTVNGFIVISSDLAASVNTRYYATASLTLTLPAAAQNGDSITLYREVGTELIVRVQGGQNILTSRGDYDTVIVDVPEEVIFSYSLGKWMVL